MDMLKFIDARMGASTALAVSFAILLAVVFGLA